SGYNNLLGNLEFRESIASGNVKATYTPPPAPPPPPPVAPPPPPLPPGCQCSGFPPGEMPLELTPGNWVVGYWANSGAGNPMFYIDTGTSATCFPNSPEVLLEAQGLN